MSLRFPALLIPFVSLPALAQTAPPVTSPPPPAPGAASAPPAGVRTPRATSGTEPPRGKILDSLEERLKQIQSGRGLTSEEVARRAQGNSAELEAKRSALRGAEAGISQTRFGYWPRLTLSASYTRLSDIDPPTIPGFPAGSSEQFFPIILDNYRLNAGLTVPLSDYVLRASSAISGASHARDSLTADQAAVAASVGRDARVIYYEWIRAQARELIAAQALEQARGQRQDAENAFQAGLSSKADVLRAEALLKNAELAVEQTSSQTRMMAVQLAVAMGDRGPANYEVGENVFADAPELAALPNVDAAYREALAKRAELKALTLAEKAARSQATLARAARYPRLDGQANFTYANPNPRYFPQQAEFRESWDVGVVLSWTPTDIGGANASSDVAEARAQELVAQRRAVTEGLRIEVEQALTAATQARIAIDATRQTVVADEEGYRVRRELFRAGRATLVEVMEAETALTTSRLRLADAYVSARIALVQLRHALGRTTPR